jgi:hypothetical protein
LSPGQGRRALTSAAGLALILLAWRVPPTQAATFPGYTTAWYISQPSTSWAYTKGCELGTAVYNGTKPGDSFVVLDFFTQFYSSTSGWGVEYDDHVFHSISLIESVVKEFAHGYWICTSSDTSAQVTIGMGTRNIWWPSTLTVAQVATRGTEWANAVWATQQSLGSYASQATVVGAIDAELSWATYDYTSAWAQAYSDAGHQYYVNYGDAAGCPPYGSCNNGYSQSKVYNLTWGILAAFPFPEIYTTSGSQAKEWQQIDLWAYNHGKSLMNFMGTLTQQEACAQKGCTTNSPSTGWSQLITQLQSNTHTDYGYPDYASDIKWDHP